MQTQPVIPSHVPPDLVLPCRIFDRMTVTENPYETILPAIHQGPRVFYAANVTPGPVPGWVVRRAEDLRAIYNDTENFYKQGNTQFAAMIGEDWDIIPTELDPPRHAGFRAALNPVYSPSNMAKLDSRVRERARVFIDRFKDRGSCEFIGEFAIPFPVTIFLDLLGFPQEEMNQFLEWETTLLRSPTNGDRITSVHAVKDYLLRAIADRKKNPGTDLISVALTLEVDGRKWTDEEVFGHCFNLYLGGLDTVTANIGLHMHHLATRPDHQTYLRENPKQMVIAIEEFLRAYPAVTTARLCRNPYTLGDATFMPGDYIAMSTPLAGRDPEYYDAPQEVRLDRKPAHVTLGYGIHRCLGQHLARRELQIALQEFLASVPTFGIAPGFSVPFFLGNVIHIDELQLAW
ncbi:cytochrome P450 [Sphingomonas chungangi]|uniref:cytochrome P450 n=1 Tax=Sphingomonas chungangi TaxID=2683589 RepID=UPI0031B5FF75